MLKRMFACSPMHSDDITTSFLLCKFNYTSHHWVTVPHTQTMKVLCQEQYFWDKDSCPTKNTIILVMLWLCTKLRDCWAKILKIPAIPWPCWHCLPTIQYIQQYQYCNTNLQKKHCLKLSSNALLVNCDGQHELLLADYHKRSKRNQLSDIFHYCSADVVMT